MGFQSRRTPWLRLALAFTLVLTIALGSNIVFAQVAHATSAGAAPWWSIDCDSRAATPVYTDTNLGLQLCYPNNYDGTQPTNWYESIPGAVASDQEFQCVELVERHLEQNKGLANKGAVDSGKNVAQYFYNWYSSMVSGLSLIYGTTDTGHSLTQVFPSVGDVLSTTWSTADSTDGHTAVIASVNITNASAGNANVTVDQQNVKGSGKDNSWAVGTITISGWKYNWSAGSNAGTLTNVEVLHFGQAVGQAGARTFIHDPANNTEVMAATEQNGSIYTATRDANDSNAANFLDGWTRHQPRDDSVFVGKPTLVYDPTDETVLLAATEQNGSVYIASRDANDNDQNDWLYGWFRYQPPNGSPVVSSPTLLYDPINDTILVAVTAQNGSIYVFTQAANDPDPSHYIAAWVRYEPLDNSAFVGNPTFLYDPTDNTIVLAATEQNGSIYVATREASDPDSEDFLVGWVRYEPPSGSHVTNNPTLTYDPANETILVAVTTENGSLHIFTLDANEPDPSLYIYGWEHIAPFDSSAFVGSPTLTYDPTDETVRVAVTEQNGSVYIATRDANDPDPGNWIYSWNRYSGPNGSPIVGSPLIFHDPTNNTVQVAVTAQNGSIYIFTQDANDPDPSHYIAGWVRYQPLDGSTFE